MGEIAQHYGRSTAFLVLIFTAGLLIGGIISFYINFQEINDLREQVATLESQVSKLSGFQNVTIQNVNVTLYQNSTAMSQLYENVRDSIVLIRGVTSDVIIQGSGFVYNFSNLIVVITNFHVVYDTQNLSVTFSNGNGYSAEINGTDAYADLAVLKVNAPAQEFKPIEIVSSSGLKVGEPVIAIGNPYGLVGSLTTGVISALGRTITEEYAGGFSIANIIQTSTPINPGNSGGPLLNYLGKVVGVTTAIAADSQGLGFAIPSNTILREIAALVTFGNYSGHSYLGVTGQDMSYEEAQSLGVNVTYGWKIATVVADGPSAGKLQANDVIIAMNGSVVKNNDDLASYLEEKTLPRQNLVLTIVRKTSTETSTLEVTVKLGTRPPPPV
jgi:S1-C subfamily serine protease